MAASCAAESAQSTTTSTSVPVPPTDPQTALEGMLADIVAGVGAPVVDDRQVVLLAGAEGATTSEIAELFTSIGSGRVAVNFWNGFSDGLTVDQFDLANVRFGRIEEFATEGTERVSVDVWDDTRQQMRTWHLARIDGEWRLDLFATFGDVYAGPLRLLIRSLDPGADGFVEVSEALAAQRVSLEFAPATDARLEVSSELAQLP